MNSKITNSVALLVFALVPLSSFAQKEASIWLTNPDRTALFQLQSPPVPFTSSPAKEPIIDVDESKTFQTIDGFGFALPWGSVRGHLSYGSHKTESAVERAFRHKRQQHRRQLSSNAYRSFGPERVRLFVRRPSPPGETNPQLLKFSLQEDQKYVIPILKQILAINPKIKILGSRGLRPLG